MLTPTVAIAAPLAQPQQAPLDATTTIENAAERYGIDPVRFLNTAKCEDPGLIPNQQSNYMYKGKRENSWGIYQINLDAHPEISIASATDPVFAANWSAKEWSEGLEHQWSCYSLLY